MGNHERFAGPSGLPWLYHYQDFQPGKPAERLVDILKNQRIYCSNPGDFNDPSDCAIYFDPGLLDNPAAHARTAEHIIAHARKRHSDLPTEAENLLRTEPAVAKAMLTLISRNERQSILERYRVYCLSKTPYSTLMWSHYARKHQGICLEFRVQGRIMSMAQRVDYPPDYPPLLIHQPDTYINFLSVKSKVWSYEEEFRLICPRDTVIQYSDRELDGNFLHLNDGDLCSIIVGCQASDETHTVITNLVKKYAPHIKVNRAVRDESKYRIYIHGARDDPDFLKFQTDKILEELRQRAKVTTDT